MGNFSFYIIPIILTIIVVYAITQKVPVFDAFLSGAKNGLKTTVSLIPTLVGLVVGISMLQASGALDILANLMRPICGFFSVPSEIASLALIKPISGSGSIAVLDNIFSNHTPDSFTGTVASIIMGSTETTFYTMAVYFGSVKISNTRHTLFCALATDIFAMILAITITKFFMI